MACATAAPVNGAPSPAAKLMTTLAMAWPRALGYLRHKQGLVRSRHAAAR